MRVVKFPEMVRLPSGTIHSDKWEGVINGLYRTDGVCRDADGRVYDFWRHSLLPQEGLDGAYGLHTVSGRFAEYDDEAEFVVYEDEDVKMLVGLLKGAMP